LLAAAFLLVAARFAFVCDDAYITFRYAKNLATGIGLVFNPGETPPVEGYSDFLWLLAASALELVHLRPDVILPAVSVGCGVALVHRIHSALLDRLDVGRTAAFFAALAFAASPATGCWATSGLETMPQALLGFLLFERLVLNPKDHGWPLPAILSVALAMIRAEGIAWVAVIYGASVVSRLAEREPLRDHLARLLRSAAPMLALFAVYTAWRLQYYGTLVPNTALVKVALSLRSVGRGIKYVLLFWATCLVPLAMLAPLPIVLRDRRQGLWLAIGLLAAAFPVYGAVVGGDFMPFGRLLVPGLPFAALILGGGLQELVRRSRGRTERAGYVGIALVLVGLLPAFDLNLVPEVVREQLHFRLSDKQYLSELNRWQNQKENSEGFTRRGLALAQVAKPRDAVVAAAVGAVGYFSGITVYDQHGLVTKEVAYRDVPDGPLTQSPGHDKHVDPDYFVKYEPKFLYARELDGKLAAGRMKETLDQWDVPNSVKDRYVPDWYEVSIPGTERAFLLVIRRLERNEDPAKLWNDFPERRKELNQELREEFGEGDDEDSSSSG
jgi:arabinofuranosyltransferase